MSKRLVISICIVTVLASTAIFWIIRNNINEEAAQRYIKNSMPVERVFESNLSLPEETWDTMDAVTRKYVGENIEDFEIINHDTRDAKKISDFEGIRIIEYISPYCPVCLSMVTETDRLESIYEDITVIRILNEKNTAGLEKIRRETESESDFYYVDGEYPKIITDMFNAGKPNFIVIDENGKVLQFAIGNIVDGGGAKEVFSSIARVFDE